MHLQSGLATSEEEGASTLGPAEHGQASECQPSSGCEGPVQGDKRFKTFSIACGSGSPRARFNSAGPAHPGTETAVQPFEVRSGLIAWHSPISCSYPHVQMSSLPVAPLMQNVVGCKLPQSLTAKSRCLLVASPFLKYLAWP